MRTALKCTKTKSTLAERAKLAVLFHLVKYANLCYRGCAGILTVNQEGKAISRSPTTVAG